ncbi:MAG TPA: metal-sensitive transcriptional regulator [Actinomycetota bacterium]|nr:metal-sensitive transcriptional regulator [Actinomycetota bacterium]
METETKDELANRLRRIEGQVRGIARMIQEDKYCIDVLTQVSAAVAALDKVGLKVVGSHMRTCVRDAVAAPGGDAGEAHIQELVDSLERFLKA